MNQKHELKTPFNSQTELLEYVQRLAKDTLTVFKLAGLSCSGMYDQWEDLSTTSIVDALGERIAALDEQQDVLSEAVDDLHSAAQEVVCDCDQLTEVAAKVQNMLTRIRVRRQ